MADQFDNNKDNDQEQKYEKFCFLCRRPESQAGKMIDLPNHIHICADCMQKSFDTMNTQMNNGNYSDLFNMPNVSMIDLSSFQNPGNQAKKIKKKSETPKPVIDLKDIPAPHKIKATLDEYVIGQEYAKKVMSVGVYNHYKRVATDTMDDIEIEKSNMLMIGPTGSGKTYLVQTLARLLDVPLALTDATSLTEAGYIGDDIESVVSKLLAAADNDVEKAERGIIFIDEIDKIAGAQHGSGPDVSREGVQRDILPIVEGCTVNTKYGPVKTDFILFIAAGAFHVSKVSDLIPELQGRFPIRVKLAPLTEEDYKRILSQPEHAITKQYAALLETDNIALQFTDDALSAIAHYAHRANESSENIGARRLHTIMETVLDDISFNASGEHPLIKVVVDENYVKEHLSDEFDGEDLEKFIL